MMDIIYTLNIFDKGNDINEVLSITVSSVLLYNIWWIHIERIEKGEVICNWW